MPDRGGGMTATANEIAGAMRAGRSHRSASPPVRSAAGIAKRFDATVALSASNLSIDAGEPVALMGENGAGKSTFVKILSGVLRPDGGTPTLRGSRARIMKRAARRGSSASISRRASSICPTTKAARCSTNGSRTVHYGADGYNEMAPTLPGASAVAAA